MIPNEYTQEIIKDFVEKAKKEEVIESNTGLHVDFSKMSDEQIGQWLVGKAQLIDPRNGEIANEDVREEYEDERMDTAWDNLVYLFLNPDLDLLDLYESKKNKKFSSFKNQQTITENFRRFLKEDAWSDGHTVEAGKYLDMSYNYSLGGHKRDDLIIKPETLAQYIANKQDQPNFAQEIKNIATEELDLGQPTGNSEGPTEYTWPKKHKEATFDALSKQLNGDKYAIAVRTIENLQKK